MTKKEKKLKNIALKARSWCEKINRQHDLFEDDFQGMCGIASVYLYKLLKQNKFRPKIIENNTHCFVECEGYIVDITATQFGYRRVFIETLEEASQDGSWWQVDKIFTNLKKFAKHQSKSWPTNQCYKTVDYLIK